MFAEQEGKCAICKKPEETSTIHIDHSHHTGRVRALLCKKCNLGLGYFVENTKVMQEAVAYLKRFLL